MDNTRAKRRYTTRASDNPPVMLRPSDVASTSLQRVLQMAEQAERSGDRQRGREMRLVVQELMTQALAQALADDLQGDDATVMPFLRRKSGLDGNRF